MDVLKRVMGSFLILLFVYQRSEPATFIHNMQVKEFQRYVESVKNQVIKALNASHPGPIDCLDVLRAGSSKSGIYRIWPLNWYKFASFQVYCDMEANGGGWTVIQQRTPSEETMDNFHKSWEEYRKGFGKLGDFFWLGNDKIFSLTDQGKYSLRIDMKHGESKSFAVYKEFWIESETYLYRLHISGYDGIAGDALSKANEVPFSTFDKPNNGSERGCFFPYSGGWWYEDCYLANLNGLYLRGLDEEGKGIVWVTWLDRLDSLSEVSMKIRRI